MRCVRHLSEQASGFLARDQSRRKDTNGARALAKRLLKIHPGEFTDWETDFLESVTSYTELFAFTARQSEKLLEIRDGAEPVTQYRGFCVAILLEQCFEARLDLSEADSQWVVGLCGRSTASIKRKHIGRLIRCARELDIIDEDSD